MAGALPVALAAIAEGAWVAAVYALVEAMVHEPAPLGPLFMGLAALVGLLAARRYAQRLGARWPRVALAIVGLTALAGCLIEPSALTALLALDPGSAIGAHPGGLLAGLACLRGMAHADADGSAVSLERLVAFGLPGLVIPALIAGMLQEPWRSVALDGIAAATLVFLVAATTGVAVVRMARLGGVSGFDWRRNRAWLALVALLAVGVVVAVLPAAAIIAPAVRVAVAVLAIPLFVVGVVAGLGNMSRRAALGILVLGVGTLILVALAPPSRNTSPDDTTGGGGASEEGDPQLVTLAGGTILLVVVIAGVVILARLWMRDTVRRGQDDVSEERMIDTGPPETARETGRGWTGWRRGGSGPPMDAAGAYIALLHDIDARPTVRREPGRVAGGPRGAPAPSRDRRPVARPPGGRL